MPYMVGRTNEVEKGLYLRQYGVPFDVKSCVAKTCREQKQPLALELSFDQRVFYAYWRILAGG